MTVAAAPAGDSGALVAARGIGVQRGERWIFRHVQLTVGRGELVYLIGANGAGKSTCAKAVLGLIEIDEGIVEPSPSIGVGYVPQRLAISPTLPLPLTLRRLMTLTGRFAARDIDAALDAVGLARLGDPPVTTLSGGDLGRRRGRPCRARADRRLADNPRRHRPPLCLKPGKDGGRRRGDGRRRGRRGATRLGKPGHAVRPVDRRRGTGALHRHPGGGLATALAGCGEGIVGAAFELDLHGDVADVETFLEAALDRRDRGVRVGAVGDQRVQGQQRPFLGQGPGVDQACT